MSKGPTRKMVVKMTVLMVLMVFVAFGTVLGQLVNIQFINGDYYQEKAINQQLRTSTINAARGTIYDCNMKAMVTSGTVWTVVLSPADIDSEEKLNKIADGLAPILGIDRATIIQKGQNKKSQFQIIARKVEKPVFDAISTFVVDNEIGNAVVMIEDSKRYYSYGDLGASIIGFTGTDNQGLQGIEAAYDNVLQGVPGKVVVAKNAYQTDMPFDYETQIEPQDGSSLVLTIDESIQAFVERSLETAVQENDVGNRAAAIVMNVKTGEILAMATEPDYDLTKPFELYDPSLQAIIDAASEEDKEKATKDAFDYQWSNKAITEPYEPGSVFKTFTAAMALEEKKVSASDSFFCPGYQIVGGIRINCARTTGHGSLDFWGALQKSCNPSFMQIGERVGPHLFFQYFKSFGFTEKTGVDLLGEASNTGLYHKEEALKPVELATSSFGQTFKVTPIQMITAFCAAVNGGYLMEPYIVSKVLDSEGNIIESKQPTVRRQVISAETSAEICKMLESVVSISGGRNAYIPGYRVGGKTGTSQKQDKYADDGTRPYRIASFCGVAPADDPQIAMLVLLDEPHGDNANGGAIAAPVLREVFEDALPHLGIQPVYSESEMENADTSAPALVGLTTSQAQTKLTQSGFKTKIIGSGDTILKQVPSQYSTMPRGGTVVLYTSSDTGQEGDVVVPDFASMTLSQANAAAVGAGLNVRITGIGLESTDAYCSKQSIAADTTVLRGTVIELEFLHKVDENVDNLIE